MEYDTWSRSSSLSGSSGYEIRGCQSWSWQTLVFQSSLWVKKLYEGPSYELSDEVLPGVRGQLRSVGKGLCSVFVTWKQAKVSGEKTLLTVALFVKTKVVSW